MTTGKTARMENTPKSGARPIDLDLVREFCDLAESHNLARLDVSYKEFSLRVSRMHEGPPPSVVVPAVPASVVAPSAADAGAAAEPAAPKHPANVIAVKSPLAGVFYRAVRPGAPPFANEGDEFSVGQTLCIIEAMKLMNEIAAEQNARVYKILVENAQVVEAGQDIILLDPL
jgi:acetyl-CoA carboxylase biotin carboxyl carrier protein